MTEIPSITGSGYVSALLTADTVNHSFISKSYEKPQDQLQRQAVFGPKAHLPHIPNTPMSITTRIVKVFIADNNENLPLEKRVLYKGEEKLTDLTDQELFFEIPMAEILAKHNEVRKQTVDKKASDRAGREVFLEPVRIRDLKMVVVTVASF